MKIINNIILVGLAVLMLSIVGCAAQGKDFGAEITETNGVPIKDILAKPEQFANHTVRVEGKITDECPAGGWFFLQDETGTIYVNLHPSYFAIPQAIGRRAVAEGRVRREGTQIEIIGKGVRLE